ncbi:MAG TPA: hypothetical protein VF941_15955 [Clostridia bacterium]
MLVIASFTYSMHLELAINYLERIGIRRESIFAIPLDKRGEKRRLFDTISQSDGISLFDVAIILATLFMLGGSIYGFVLKWGPILCGVIGSIIGALIGFAIDIIPKKGKHNKNKPNGNTSEVFLLIECEKKDLEVVEGILWDNLAIGIAKIDNSNSQ